MNTSWENYFDTTFADFIRSDSQSSESVLVLDGSPIYGNRKLVQYLYGETKTRPTILIDLQQFPNPKLLYLVEYLGDSISQYVTPDALSQFKEELTDVESQFQIDLKGIYINIEAKRDINNSHIEISSVYAPQGQVSEDENRTRLLQAGVRRKTGHHSALVRLLKTMSSFPVIFIDRWNNDQKISETKEWLLQLFTNTHKSVPDLRVAMATDQPASYRELMPYARIERIGELDPEQSRAILDNYASLYKLNMDEEKIESFLKYARNNPFTIRNMCRLAMEMPDLNPEDSNHQAKIDEYDNLSRQEVLDGLPTPTKEVMAYGIVLESWDFPILSGTCTPLIPAPQLLTPDWYSDFIETGYVKKSTFTLPVEHYEFENLLRNHLLDELYRTEQERYRSAHQAALTSWYEQYNRGKKQ